MYGATNFKLTQSHPRVILAHVPNLVTQHTSEHEDMYLAFLNILSVKLH
jgi:hypothetical protein